MSRVTGRSTRMATPSVTSTWRRTNDTPVAVTAGDLEKEQLLDDALDEYCRLRDQGGTIRATQFCERFPSYRHSLRRLIDVHEAMENYAVVETNQWPELLSEFLGFEILHELGVGAIARVYLAAERAVGGRLVAIKVAKGGGYEAETLGKLSHRNVVPVYSVQQDEETGMTAVCMPYYGSSTLADLLDLGFENGKPPARAATILRVARERERFVGVVEAQEDKAQLVDPILDQRSYVDGIAHLGCQMAEALEYTHERGILHRDLKPSNVLLTPDGIPMLLDFNLATDIEVEVPTLGGTLPYMPPEQIKDVHLKPFEAKRIGDPRSDIFSLGVILYELLTGTLPFGAPEPTSSAKDAANAHLKEQQDAPVSLHKLNPGVDASLERTINRCLSMDIAERPATATELADELLRYFSPRQRLVRWCRRHFTALMTVSALLLVAGSLLSWHLVTRPPYDARQYMSGIAEIERGEFREAITRFDRIMDSDEQRIPFLFTRGAALQRQGEHELAAMDFGRIGSRSNEPAVLELSAYSAAQNVKTVGLAKICYGLLSQRPDANAQTFLNHAYSTYRLSPRSPGVVRAASRAIEMDPTLQLAYQVRALSHKSLGEIDLAINDMDEAIRLGPIDGFLLSDAASVYKSAEGDEREARLKELIRIAIEAGAPRGFLITLAREDKDEEWFKALVAGTPPGDDFPSSARVQRYISVPDYDRAQELMRRYGREFKDWGAKP